MPSFYTSVKSILNNISLSDADAWHLASPSGGFEIILKRLYSDFFHIGGDAVDRSTEARASSDFRTRRLAIERARSEFTIAYTFS
jgi:hypothetical protein